MASITTAGTKIPHPISTRYHDSDRDEFPRPPSKRLKIEDNNGVDDSGSLDSGGSSARRNGLVSRTLPTQDEDDDERYDDGTTRSKRSPRKARFLRDDHVNGYGDGHDVREQDIQVSPTKEEDGGLRSTQLESALPVINLRSDQEAIEAYEAYRAGLHLDQDRSANPNDTAESRLESRSWIRGRSSIYVDAFNLTLDTVLGEEDHLFDDAERTLFAEWRGLSYEAQYLYVRLFLRKTSKWFRVRDLGYYDDVANLDVAVAELQEQRNLPDVEEEDFLHPGEQQLPEGNQLGSSFKFAECSSEEITTLDEASSLLLLDELKAIAKDAKVVGKNKAELLRNLRQTSGRQGGLGFKRTDTEESNGSIQSEPPSTNDHDDEEDEGTLTPGHKTNRDAHFTRKILNQTGRCIRLSLTPLKSFERVHLVFYRSTEWTEKSLTTLILAKISRRNFPEYIVSRSASIFSSRNMLLEFEASLRTQFHVDSILEFNGTPGKKQFEEVLRIFGEVYPRWKTLLKEEQNKEDRIYQSGEGAYLRRFNPAWVYTRIVHKALGALARFKEHLREHDLLVELLTQRLFHAARRGAWYQRKALLEEHYMFALTPSEGRGEEANKKHWKRVALRTSEEGLQDPECHVIYHCDLQKRIRKIEKQLKIPVREQHDFGHVMLGKAVERTVEGIKVEREATPSRSLTRKNSTGSNPDADTNRRGGGKTIWLDELDTNDLVSVESMCLSHYRKVLGWKGYHCEGRVLGTLFGLLFYDVLFAYVPNVFQTAYQTCPLDLHTDAFYGTRISEINSRINEIANGDAETIIRQTWDTHVERKTCIVGVRWDDYAVEDILEIAGCFKGEALGTVMRVMAQEYAARGGGVPDLFLWRVDQDTGTGEVMFSEVKSENDRLSDTQRLWISVLLGAGIKVELCHAAAKELRVDR